jgi:hypothetical protein
MKFRPLAFALAFLYPWLSAITSLAQTEAELKNLKIDGGIQDGKARLTIEALLNGQAGSRDKLIFATSLQHTIKPTKTRSRTNSR